MTATNYIPRFSENDYAANGWIKFDSDVLQQNNHPQTIIESRPATRAPSSRTVISTIPPASDHEMIIGLLF